MKRTGQKINGQNQSRVRLRFNTTLIIVLFVAVAAGSSAWKLWQLYTQVEDQLAQLNQEKALLLQQEKILHDEIELLNTPEYIEKLAREQLGLVKKGEILISPKN